MTFDPYQSFKKENDHFVKCILENKEPRITGKDARNTVACLQAAYEFAEKGKTIAII